MREKYKLKKPLNRWVVFVLGILLGLSVNVSQQIIYSTQTNFQATAPLLAATADIRIEYTGNPGVNCKGHYSVGVTDGEGRSELFDVDANLPYTVNLKVRPDAHITAGCLTSGNQNLKVKIFRNGVECKYDNIKGYEPNKSCSPPRI
jgi:hypothetical protein